MTTIPNADPATIEAELDKARRTQGEIAFAFARTLAEVESREKGGQDAAEARATRVELERHRKDIDIKITKLESTLAASRRVVD